MYYLSSFESGSYVQPSKSRMDAHLEDLMVWTKPHCMPSLDKLASPHPPCTHANLITISVPLSLAPMFDL